MAVNDKYSVIIYKDSDGYWVAKYPDLISCIGVGETKQEALAEAEINKAVWIQDAIDNDEKLPPIIITKRGKNGEPLFSIETYDEW